MQRPHHDFHQRVCACAVNGDVTSRGHHALYKKLPIAGCNQWAWQQDLKHNAQEPILLHCAAPVEPGLVSVLSAQQRRIVLNIIGPPTWNRDPVGFNVAWQVLNDRRGPHGELKVPLPPNWSTEENSLNATLPLPGGHDYCLSVSALGSDGADNDIWGPAVDVNVSLPLDYYEISAHAIGPSRAVISWRASEIVEVFKVTVYIDYDEGNLDFYSMWEFEGTDTTSSRPTVLVTDLPPWMYYMSYQTPF
ncbi:uncharacterized protein [Dermacentor albipictus]|uniref:uncharacterized protein n=1 Tax=Dermacentor albipictus TaxID=60249 RepID=UPI0038FCC268